MQRTLRILYRLFLIVAVFPVFAVFILFCAFMEWVCGYTFPGDES